MLPSAAEIVARFLRANSYNETLAAFLKEAGLPPDAGSISKGDVTIEQILQEKKTFDLSVNFEKLGIDDENRGWRAPAPSLPITVTDLPASNILSTTIEPIILPDADVAKPYIVATTADRRLHIMESNPNSPSTVRSHTHLQDSPILSFTIIENRYLLCASMSGKLILYDCKTDQVLVEKRDHSKYVVKAAHWQSPGVAYIATAGWDAKVHLYRMHGGGDTPPTLEGPVGSLALPSNPESLLFVQHPGATLPLLLVTRRDSTFLYYYSISSLAVEEQGASEGTLSLVGKQNLAPHSNAWVAFTPSFVAVSPLDPSVVAIATSTVPFMKILIVRLLLPPPDAESLDAHKAEPIPIAAVDGSSATATTQARAELALQDKEDAAILVHCSTQAPQTPYSTPALTWRPDGSGIWVNSDDGVIRGVEAATGKVVASLKGHEAGAKIRCLFAGTVENEEVLVSGGFDQRLIFWKAEAKVG